MKKFITLEPASIATALALFAFVSCINSIQDDSEVVDNEKVTVNISLSGFNLSFEEDEVTTRASDQNAAQAEVTRIARSVFDGSEQLVYSSKKKSSVNTEDFDSFSCELLPGSYTFVAVAHKANADSDEAATITSPTVATITTDKVYKTFAKTQAVTIVEGQTNNVTIDFGKRITSTFQIATTDDTPTNVASCEIIINPSLSTTTAYTINPSTGLATDIYQQKVTILKSNTGNTFKDKALSIYCFLKENPQNIAVTVNMKDASGNVVQTRTFNDVPMAPHRVTRARGIFFPSSASGSFTFDNSDDDTHLISF